MARLRKQMMGKSQVSQSLFRVLSALDLVSQVPCTCTAARVDITINGSRSRGAGPQLEEWDAQKASRYLDLQDGIVRACVGLRLRIEAQSFIKPELLMISEEGYPKGLCTRPRILASLNRRLADWRYICLWPAYPLKKSSATFKARTV